MRVFIENLPPSYQLDFKDFKDLKVKARTPTPVVFTDFRIFQESGCITQELTLMCRTGCLSVSVKKGGQ